MLVFFKKIKKKDQVNIALRVKPFSIPSTGSEKTEIIGKLHKSRAPQH